MKVLQILPEMNAGGVERGTLELAAHLVAHGHQAVVVSNGGRMVPALETAGARHISMPVHRKRLSSFGQVRPLRRLLAAEAPDIVHIRSRVPGWITWLAWKRMDPASRPALVSTVHGMYSTGWYSSVMTRGQRVIAVSRAVKTYILDNYSGVPAGRVRVVPRGIDPAQYTGFRPPADWLARWQTEHPGLEKAPTLLLPGRITRLKGHDDFFALIAALRSEGIPACGLVAGDTHPKKRAYLDELREQARQLGIDGAISFLGHRSDLREVMAVSSVVCSLSKQPEAFGRTTLEALALGRPVVGYDCGGVGEILGELLPAGKVRPGDAGDLLEKTRSALLRPETPATVGPPFTLDAMCEGTMAVYRELLR